MGLLLLEDSSGLRSEDGRAPLEESGSGILPTIGEPPLNTSLRDVTLVAPTQESLEVDVYCSSDPTVTDPEFAVTTEGTLVVDGATYYAGAWSTSYGTDGWTSARTPTFGTQGTIDVTAGSRLWLWIKTVAGTETAVWRVGTVIVL